MPRDREKYLFDMLDACRFLLGLTADETVERYVRDRMFRGAVERELQIIGEAMMQLKSMDRSCAEQITEHKRMISFRHVLVHGYDVIDSDVVWHVVKEKLPVLRHELEAVLNTG